MSQRTSACRRKGERPLPRRQRPGRGRVDSTPSWKHTTCTHRRTSCSTNVERPAVSDVSLSQVQDVSTSLICVSPSVHQMLSCCRTQWGGDSPSATTRDSLALGLPAPGDPGRTMVDTPHRGRAANLHMAPTRPQSKDAVTEWTVQAVGSFPQQEPLCPRKADAPQTHPSGKTMIVKESVRKAAGPLLVKQLRSESDRAASEQSRVPCSSPTRTYTRI